MHTTGRYFCTTASIGILSILLISLASADSDQKLTQQLHATLNDFAKMHSLSGEEMQRLLGKTVLGMKNYRKGGLGIIDNGTFIVLDEKENAIRVAGHEWRGGKSDSS